MSVKDLDYVVLIELWSREHEGFCEGELLKAWGGALKAAMSDFGYLLGRREAKTQFREVFLNPPGQGTRMDGGKRQDDYASMGL